MQNLLKTTFQQKYSHENFTKFLAQTFQKSSSDFEFQQVFPDNENEKYFDTRHLLSFETDDKKTIEVLTIELKTKSNIENARSYQRGLIEKYIKNRIHQNKWVDGVLVAFWNNYESSWRLSFVTMDLKDGKQEFSPFKRYSFLVGENESTHTVEQQFLEILKPKKTPLFLQLLEVFSVEKVTDEFFEAYKKHFLSLNTKFLENEIFQKEVIEKQGVKNADFVKKLMGQVVFLYFLQKKGWMGVAEGKKWGTGNKNFMRDLLDECLNGGDLKKERGGKNFFNDYLEHLFYDTLNNKDRGGASVSGDYSWTEYFQCRIPYLNGGLFEPVYEWEKTYIDIPNDIFEGLFNTFDRYNFTVYESDSLETDVAVDPEMLGKVFENLLEIDERKGKGAFYTPREIVHYMCQESLINYLTNSSGYEESRIRNLMKRKDQITAKSEAEKKEIENNVELKEVAGKIDELLKTVTVCDPAVGSGAFPMGMLKEIVSLRFFLNRHFVKAKHERTGKFLNEYDIKKETLENCIYGVDIEPGAIEICRLRFWLSMVVEHDIEEVEPLPNLDYKLMQGNSLLEDLVIGDSVIKLNIDSGNKGDKRTKEMKNLLEEESQGALFSMDSHSEVVDKLQKLHAEFFDQTDPEKKKVLKTKIDEYENLFIETACNDEIKNLRDFSRDERAKSQIKKAEKAEEQIVLIQQTLEKWKKDHIRPFFPWKLHFGEIFKEGGFDIVIGNPPYIQLQKDGGFLANMFENANYQTFVRSGDIYALFYELGNQLLQNNGHLTFITSNKWMRAGYGQKLRKYFAENTTPKILLDLGPGVFETATVDTNILLFEKGKFHENSKCLACDIKVDLAKKNIKLEDYIEQNKIDLTKFTDEAWTILNPKEQAIKEKIEKIGTPLKDWDIKISYGIRTGLNEAFIIDGKKKNELIAKDPKSAKIIKPILRGKDIKRYSDKFSDLYVILVRKNFADEFEQKYSTLYDFVSTFEEKLKNRGQVRAGSHHWIEIDNSPTEIYLKQFEKEKIVWQEMVQEGNFFFDDFGFFCNDTGRIMTGENLKFLLPILNSKLFFFAVKTFYGGGGLGAKGVRMKHTFFENFCVPQIPTSEQKPFIDLVDKILEITSRENYDPKNPPTEQKELEKKIDEMVFDLYGLTEEERAIVLNN